MTGWLIFAAYMAAFVVTGRAVVRFTHLDDDSPRDPEDRVLDSVLAMCCGMIWPLVLLAAAMLWKMRPTPAERAAALDERERLVAERERRTADLERELGIGE